MKIQRNQQLWILPKIQSTTMSVRLAAWLIVLYLSGDIPTFLWGLDTTFPNKWIFSPMRNEDAEIVVFFLENKKIRLFILFFMPNIKCESEVPRGQERSPKWVIYHYPPTHNPRNRIAVCNLTDILAFLNIEWHIIITNYFIFITLQKLNLILLKL